MNLYISHILTTFAFRRMLMKEIANIKHIVLSACVLLLLEACSPEGGSNNTIPPTSAEKLPISINATMSTRATDKAFEEGDNIGLFVVNRNADGSASKLQVTGNYVDNCKFTYHSGTWSPTNSLYWKDETTHADFYLYYPYTANLSNVDAMPWSIKADQSKAENYKASDLLVGQSNFVAPSKATIPIEAKHLTSLMTITLVAGSGFTEASLSTANISIQIHLLKTHATVNLANGVMTATGEETTIIPLKENGKYKALVIPQTVSDGNLITVTVDGEEHRLSKTENFKVFETGKSYQFTVTLNKSSNGVNASITQWEDDGIDYGGTAE